MSTRQIEQHSGFCRLYRGWIVLMLLQVHLGPYICVAAATAAVVATILVVLVVVVVVVKTIVSVTLSRFLGW